MPDIRAGSCSSWRPSLSCSRRRRARPPRPAHKLTQAGFRVLYMAPAFIALEKGLFAQEGIDFTFTEIDSGALGAAAVISGNAQISDLDPLGVARLQQEGKSLLLFYNLVGRVTLDLIMRTPVAQKLGLTAETPLPARYAALKGLTIGITRPGAPTDVFARYFLVGPASTPTATPPSSRSGGVPALAAAFKAERIDAFLLSPPLPQTLERDGVGRIVIRNTAGDVPELRNTTYVAMFTTADYASATGRPAGVRAGAAPGDRVDPAPTRRRRCASSARSTSRTRRPRAWPSPSTRRCRPSAPTGVSARRRSRAISTSSRQSARR